MALRLYRVKWWRQRATPQFIISITKLSLVKTHLCLTLVHWPCTLTLYVRLWYNWPYSTEFFFSYWPFSLASSASISFEPHLFLRCNILVWVFWISVSVPLIGSAIFAGDQNYFITVFNIKNIIKLYYFYLCLFYKGYFVFALFKKVSFKNSTSEDKVLKGPPFTFDSLAPKMMSEGQKKKN